VYKVVGYYDREAKKPKSKSLGCVGQIYEDIGFVPNKKEAGPVEHVTKEYGATRIAMAASKDIFEKLRECFPADFIRIYVMTVLKLLDNLSMKDMDTAYVKSAVSVMLPEVHLSKNTVSSFLSSLSLQRDGMVKFMREYAHCGDGGIIFDGTSFVSGARLNPFCEKGYSPGSIGKTQIRLIYAYSRENRLPIYFLVAPGSTSDKAAFEVALEEIGGKGCTIILDKGFFSAKNINLMEGMDFIVPLQKNTTLVSAAAKDFSAYEQAIPNMFTYHKRIIYYTEVKQEKFNGCKIYIFYDNERRQYLMENYFRKAELKGEAAMDESIEKIAADTAGFGVSILLTSLPVSAKQVYLDYKARWEIEEMFDTHKNTLGFDMKYEASSDILEGWAFIEFLALLIYHKINGLLVASDMIKKFNVKDILFKASTVTQSKTSGAWKICNLSKPLMDIFKKLGISTESIA
jgi:transposase